MSQSTAPNDRIDMLTREVATGFERIEKFIVRLDERITTQDQVIARVGKTNWGNVIAAAVFALMLMGMLAALVEARIQPIVSREDSLWQAYGQLRERADMKFDKLDAVDNESRVDRASTREALKETETQIRLGKEIVDLKLQIESLARNLAVERAGKKQSQADQTEIEQSILNLRTDLSALRGYVYSHHQREK